MDRRSEEELLAIYDQGYVDQYDPDAVLRIRRLLPLFALSGHEVVADFGCGNGVLLEIISPHVREYVGLDFSEPFVRAAERRRDARGIRNGTFHCVDIAAFCEDHPNHFDAGFALDFSEHIYDDQFLRIFRAIHGALKPGAFLYLHTPNAEYFMERLKERGPLQQVEGHVAVRDARRNLALLAQCGFASVDVRYLAHYLYLASTLHGLGALPLVGRYFRARLFLTCRKEEGDSVAETREVRSVVEAAEQAAAGGDYASAEQLLREAALLQEDRLGPFHPDLANTLNNLGVVCDIRDKPADAERCYRRACAIATAVLEPHHPFVATSRRNLRDFCEARGKPVERPVEWPASPPRPTAQGTSSVRSSHRLVIGALAASGLVLMLLAAIALRGWFSSNRRAEILPASATQSQSATPPSAPRPLPVEPIVMPGEPAPKSREPAGTQESRPTAAPAPAPPLVADAHLCRDLSTGGSRSSPGDWQCDRPSLPVDPGSLFFYTRLKSAGDTTVQHRWYRGEELRKVVELRIRANSTGGYRTYSRSTVDNVSGGNWRVELRTEDGTLLHEERFVVR